MAIRPNKNISALEEFLKKDREFRNKTGQPQVQDIRGERVGKAAIKTLSPMFKNLNAAEKSSAAKIVIDYLKDFRI
jgi:hypothetical protein